MKTTDCTKLGITLAGVLALSFTSIYGETISETQKAELLSKATDHGTSFIIEAAFPNTKSNARDLAKLKAAILRRAAKLPIKIFWEPVSPTRIHVSVATPSQEVKDQVKNSLFRNGVLEFRLMHPDSEKIIAGFAAPDPDYKVETYKDVRDGKPFEEQVLVKKKADIPGSMVAEAHAYFDRSGWGVSIRFSDAGAKLFGQLTTANVGNRFAMVLDQVIQSAPVIRSAIWSGSATISGSFTEDQARQLASVLESPLPASVSVVQSADF